MKEVKLLIFIASMFVAQGTAGNIFYEFAK